MALGDDNIQVGSGDLFEDMMHMTHSVPPRMGMFSSDFWEFIYGMIAVNYKGIVHLQSIPETCTVYMYDHGKDLSYKSLSHSAMPVQGVNLD